MKGDWGEYQEYEGIPCTCPDDGPCNDPTPYKGECGCKACHTAYQDYLSTSR